MKNYHTVMVVLSGLTKAHITRLKKSWEVGDPAHQRLCTSLRVLIFFFLFD